MGGTTLRSFFWRVHYIILSWTMSEDATQQLERQKKIDTLLNKTVLDLGVYSAIGYSVGLLTGVLFRNGQGLRYALSGMGGSYGFVINKSNLKQYA